MIGYWKLVFSILLLYFFVRDKDCNIFVILVNFLVDIFLVCKAVKIVFDRIGGIFFCSYFCIKFEVWEEDKDWVLSNCCNKLGYLFIIKI